MGDNLPERVMRCVVFYEMVEVLMRNKLGDSNEAKDLSHREARQREETFRGKLGVTAEEESLLDESCNYGRN